LSGESGPFYGGTQSLIKTPILFDQQHQRHSTHESTRTHEYHPACISEIVGGFDVGSKISVAAYNAGIRVQLFQKQHIMNQHNNLIVNPWKEHSGQCDCCGHVTQRVWGDIASTSGRLAVYFVDWTVAQPTHYPNIDLIIGAWGDGSDPSSRVLLSILYRPASDGGSFMIVDAQQRAQQFHTLTNKGMLREEVVGTPLATEAFAMIDAIWLRDPRIHSLKALNQFA
jgi:hypothetical protein